jgi:hypothetical protein
MIYYKKNPVKNNKIIEVDGQQYQAKYIGKGQYSKVYRVGDRVVYYTRGDCGKEVISLYVYEKHTHIPEIIRHENITTSRGRWYVFSSPYYRNVTRANTSAWVLMNIIIKEYTKFRKEYYHYQSQAYGRIKEGDRSMLAFIEYLRERRTVPQSVLKALFDLYELAINCGDRIGFDFKKNNFGVNEYGTLIFRDPIWVWG